MNPLFKAMGGGTGLPGPFGNIQAVMTAFQQFKSQFTGDPQQTVQQLLSSGKITQEQVNQAQQMASQFQQFTK